MIIDRFDATALSAAFGIDMGSVDGLGTGAAWGRVAPGVATTHQRHDETELLVIVAGRGELAVGAAHHPVAAGTVALLEPFEDHVVANTGEEDLVFLTQYWRDGARAVSSAAPVASEHGERPVFVFSTPPTPNGDLHLGHLAGPYLGADAYVRFQRMNGASAWHLTGSDDFQSYVVDRARREGRSSAEVAAYYSAEIAETLRLMDIPLDQYTVTNADPGYVPALKDFFTRLVSSGAIAPADGPALFDPRTGQYLYEVDVHGGCPGCGEATAGNICELCGEPNTVVDLAGPVAGPSGGAPVTGTARRYVLPLHEHADAVLDHQRRGRVPARLRELAARLFRRERIDIPVSHPGDWGITPHEADGAGQVIWAWPEMAFGFLHGIQRLGERLGRDWTAARPADDWKVVHFFGYDNSFYHAILYPVLYRLALPGWTPDIDYHVNEFLLYDGLKFSTSRRHAVWGKQILDADSVDAVRYFLARNRPEVERTNFTLDAYEHTLTATLIGTWQAWLHDLGQRVADHYDGVAPDAGNWTPEHAGFLGQLAARLGALAASLRPGGFSLNQSAAELDALVTDTVRFSRRERALAQAGGMPDEVRTATALELAAAWLLAHAATPVMPRFAARLAEALGQPAPRQWPATVELIPPGSKITLAQITFFHPPRPLGPLGAAHAAEHPSDASRSQSSGSLA
ncbi:MULTISPECIES: class I tRNA ligase family protein [Protofrankia]|uniref:Methionyl-tRNA synthetase n=1 Tax=Protofrankia coriariae TaxID=1562887 RepID=A0ABR5F5Z6_9ACTN|nr:MULTISPECIES: class I tRNA ligase family protein [Protofrankia]KLL12158.1 methionyl-tRNA synthetase [Protofrankia coriariae]ONH37051.1 methionine--tRNA ligase [Protofrankia sp. BMG5.30]